MKRNFRAGQWVWYRGKNSISQGTITRIENNICIFEVEGCTTIKIEESKCYISIKKMIKAKNDKKN